MKIEFNATTRTLQGTGASRRLRRANRVPAILYGGKNPAQPIDIDHNELFHKIKLEAFHSSVLTMNLDGKPEQVLLRDYQMHAFRPIVQHADFQRVDANSKIHMKVPLHFVNADISPGVKVSGGIISHVMIEIEVSCLPAHLPEFIEVDLANLTAGHSLHVSGLQPVEGVTFVTPRGEDPVVATVTIPRAAVEAEAGAAVAAADVPAVNQPPKAAAPAKTDAKKK